MTAKLVDATGIKFWGDKFWLTIGSGALGGFIDYRQSSYRLRVAGLNEEGTAIVQDPDTVTEINEKEGIVCTSFGKKYQIKDFHPIYQQFLDIAAENPDAIIAVNREWGECNLIDRDEIREDGVKKEAFVFHLDLPKDTRILMNEITVFKSEKLKKTVIVAPFSTKSTSYAIGNVGSEVLAAIKATAAL